jgi:HK97 family phage major capsid protein
LSVDNDGVFYEFESPQTIYGDELLEHIKRGEISQSSFAFTVSPEDGAEKWTKRSDGVIQRDIYKIARLYDISPVYQPAYTETTCSKRALEKLDEIQNMDKDELTKELTQEQQEIEMLKSRIAELENQLNQSETTDEDETRTDKEDEEKETENQSEINNETESNTESENDTENNTQTDTEENTESESENETTESDEDEEEKTDKNIRNIMEKFSLLKEIRGAMADGTNKIDMRAYTVTDEGTDVVGTDIFDIFAPLRAKNVLTDAGVRVLTGIKNNVQVPVFGATEAKFANETANASDGSGAISSVKLSPKRVTAKIPVSLELLSQDSVGVENMIREDLANAVYAAIEDKAFGRQAESTDVYAGLCKWPANASIGDASTFAGVANAEAAVEGAGVDTAKCKWIVSPTGKAKLRAMAKSTKTTQLVLENGEIDGTPVLSTGHLNDVSINGIYGDWSNCLIGTWDNVQLDIVRDTASLSAGQVNIIVNAYVDFKNARPGAFAYVKI